MSFRWFVVPALRPGPATEELNDFLAEVRVMSVQRGLIQDAGASFWSVCVEFEDDAESLPERLRAGARWTSVRPAKRKNPGVLVGPGPDVFPVVW
jgi:hypothetical protein